MHSQHKEELWMKVTDEAGCVISAPGNMFYQLSVNTNSVLYKNMLYNLFSFFFFFLVQSQLAYPQHQHCTVSFMEQ